MNNRIISGNSVVSVPDEKDINEGAPRPIKRICAIHDLSCFGRCALTVVIPALSALGYQVVPIPTALLSTHTGGFDGLHFLDLTDSISPISEHFDRLGLDFDAIYTGFLGSEHQIELVEKLIERFGDNKTVMVDPVMGDDGTLYSTYNNALMQGMSKLCRHADIITPNLTEACFLTGTPYRNTANMTKKARFEYLEGLCKTLSRDGKRRIVITGISDGEELLATYAVDPNRPSRFYHTVKRVSKNYPGTGDLFASVLLGELMRTQNFFSAVEFASDFTSKVMAFSAEFDTPTRDGVALEAFLGELAARNKHQENKKAEKNDGRK